MGLCKCPKRKVTNLFCFEHRVNVCENCLVDSHESCVVQSYLAWLTDSDFDPNCTLCNQLLGTGETVRLQCLHVFHWSCLNSRMKQLPSTTAPAGYMCPCCKEAVFPASNQTSPVIDRLRIMLMKANWARNGLGHPILPELDHMHVPEPVIVPPPVVPQPMRNPRDTPTVLDVEGYTQNYAPPQETQFTSRSKGPMSFEEPNSAETSRLLGRDADSPENKYKRRSASEWLTRWFRSRLDHHGDSHIGNGRRKVFLIFLVIFVLITFFTILSRGGYLGPSSDDPMFDPKANPHIRAEEVVARDW
ncbi:hypothetical protein L596_011441 [Steinernema carpocapsae]|uniref:Zinc finger protein-like 1 homolog n=1 Tax=Steinernema carpocapsae TaxID=34508 RepID=A0A4U5NTW4_STECR|nr:hypothetical protein L596_011441 [Steinernema carpocapsae]